MAEIPTGIQETQVQNAKVIDIQAARKARQPEVKQDQSALSADRQDARQGQEAKIQPETLPKEGGKEPILASPAPEHTRLLHEEADTRNGLAKVRQKLREEQQSGEGASPITGEAAAPDPNTRDIQEKEWYAGKRDAPPGKMKIVLDKDTYTFIDTPEEKNRKREQIPEKEREQLATIIENFGSRPLSEDEWKTLEGSRNLKIFFDSLDDTELAKVGFI